MGIFLRFFSRIGTPGMTAWNASVFFQACQKSGAFIEESLVNQANVDNAVLLIARRSQDSKPIADYKKEQILREFESIRFKSLISYVCLCLRHEANASGNTYDAWLVWIEIIDDVLIKRGVPACIRYGYGADTREEYLCRFDIDKLYL